MVRKFGDVLAGSFLLIVSVVIFCTSLNISAAVSVRLGADFMPKVLSVILGLLSSQLILSGVTKIKQERVSNGTESESASGDKTVWILLAIISFYVITVNTLGFLLATFLFLVLQMGAMAEQGQRKWRIYALIAAASSVAIYLVFRYAFDLFLPEGLLF